MSPSRRSSPFVGRAEELDALEDALDAASDGLVIALIGADAGMGKTALAHAFADRVRERDIPVHWGSCVEVGGAPAFWPWVQVLRTFGEEAVELADRAITRRADEPFAALETLADVLHRRGDRPRVIVLDDLHRADLASLELLRFMSLTAHDLPVLVIGTHRLHELRSDPVREAMLSAAATRALRIEPRPLGLEEVRVLLEAVDRPAGDRELLAAEVLERSGGNAFYVEQFVDAFERRGPAGLEDVPDGIRAAVRARLAPLPAETRTALSRAAILGRGFSPTVLAALTGVALDDVPALLAPAVAEGIVEAGPDDHHFEHVLVREALADDLDPVERARTHAAAAEALTRPGGRRVAPAVVAQHLADAGELADPATAAAWAERAAGTARRLGGYREAARWTIEAAEAWARAGDTARRADALVLALGDLVTAGDGSRALALSAELADLARRSDDGRLLARAALARAEVFEPTQEIDAPPLLREALAHPDVADDLDLRTDLYWGLASVLGIPTVAGPRADAAGARQALRELERLAELGVPLGRFRLLYARLDVESGPINHRSRQAWFEEANELAPRPTPLIDQLRRAYWATSLAFEAGDLPEVERRLRHWEQLADRADSSFWRWRAGMARASLSYATGHYALAERALEEHGDRLTDLHPDLAFVVQGGLLFTMRRDQGRLGDLVSGVGDGLGVVSALVAMENGTPSDVRRHLGPLVAAAEASGPDDIHWLCLMSMIAVAAEGAGDPDRCRWAADALEPYRGQLVMWGRSYVVGMPVAEAVAVARRGAGERQKAADAFREVIAWADRAGAPGFASRARVGLASVLPAGEWERARLIEDATATATALGLGLVLREIENLTEGAEPAPPEPAALPVVGSTVVPAGPVAMVRTVGRFEVVPAGGRGPSRWSSRKARDALKILITRRGRAVPREELLELLWPGVDVATGRSRLSVVLSMVRSVLDPDRLLASDPLRSDRQSVAIDLDLVHVDVEHFLTDAAAALVAHDAKDPRAPALLEAALGHVGDGEFLAEDPYNDFALGLRAAVRRTRVDVMRALAHGAEAEGDRQAAVTWLERLVDVDPDDAGATHELVGLYRVAGRHGEARALLQALEARRARL